MADRGIIFKVNSLFRKLEKIGVIKKTPNIITNHHQDYSKFKILEDNYSVIRKECENILTFKDDITDVRKLMNDTKGGIHTIKWKSFFFKSGVFIKENCDLCPETYKLLKKISGIRTAFFSILDPKQYITPHEGYYAGFMRYHLGVMIPNNNVNKECWIRAANDIIEKDKLPELGDKYYWKDGEGVVFNDTYTHDARNDSDQIRVILYVDVERKLPLLLSWINTLMLNIGYSTNAIKEVAKNSVVKPSASTSAS